MRVSPNCADSNLMSARTYQKQHTQGQTQSFCACTQALGGCEPPVSDAVRQLCSARLIAGIDTASKTPSAAVVTSCSGSLIGTHMQPPHSSVLLLAYQTL